LGNIIFFDGSPLSGLETDTIGGYNAMLSKQQKEPGEAIVTPVLFDDNFELLHLLLQSERLAFF